MRIIEATDEVGVVQDTGLLQRCEAVHRQLRPHLPEHYVDSMQQIFDNGGRLTVALASDGEPVGIALYHLIVNTLQGRTLYVDDLVTDERRRSTGIGAALMQWLEQKGRALNCTALTLDSGTQRQRAHRFYLREGMVITSFHFAKALR